jgi:hypothetical protein
MKFGHPASQDGVRSFSGPDGTVHRAAKQLAARLLAARRMKNVSLARRAVFEPAG